MGEIQSLFSDRLLQTKFEANGYVKVPFLNSAMADELYKLFTNTRALHHTTTCLHHTTTDTQNLDLIREVDTTIKQLFVPPLKKIMNEFKPLAGCFHIKESGAGSATGIHQDPTFTDEKTFISANVWVALHDMDERNGNLFFIPGSHKIASLRVTPYSPNYYDDFYDSLMETAVHVPMKKGEAVIFNNATIHGATDNMSNNLRVAATLLICSKQADWLLYYKGNDVTGSHIEKYVLDFEKFIAMPKNGRPEKSALKEIVSYNFPRLTKEEFLTAIESAQRQTYFQQVKNVLKSITA
jgi:hypothetical protein